MRVSLSYITSTTPVSRISSDDAVGAGPHVLQPLGYLRSTGAVYLLHSIEDRRDQPPTLRMLHTRGRHAGRLIPVLGWSAEHHEDRATLAARVRQLSGGLVALEPESVRMLVLNTRVAKRRALHMWRRQPPIRKYELRLAVRASRSMAPLAAGTPPPLSLPPGVVTVTAYLRPRARLHQVWRIPGERQAVEIVEYVGVPFALGYASQAAVLVPLYSAASHGRRRRHL